MGVSYQDIDVRLRVLEDKLDFVMKTFTITKVEEGPLVGSVPRYTKMSLLDVYRDIKATGTEVLNASE